MTIKLLDVAFDAQKDIAELGQNLTFFM